MNNKINKYKYPIIIILLCIVCIILVAVFFPEYKGLYVLFALGIIVSGVYLIRKYKKTAKVAPDSPYSGSADDKDLDPEIYEQIEKYRDITIKGKFHHDFVQEFIESDDKELDGEKLDENALKTLKTLKTYYKFLSTTKNYLNNNELSIENYFNEILPLFKNTEKNTDDLKKKITKYVVFYYLPEYNKVDVEKPHNYKILVDLYIKNKIKNEVDEILSGERIYWNNLKYTNLEALTPNARNQLKIKHTGLKTKYEKDILIAYIKELLKDVEEKDVEEKDKIITYITTPPSYGNNFHLN